jgi:hypothetical protein
MTVTGDEVSANVLSELLQAIQSLRYGSVEITVHDGRITQIEKREKVRFSENKPTSTASGDKK